MLTIAVRTLTVRGLQVIEPCHIGSRASDYLFILPTTWTSAERDSVLPKKRRGLADEEDDSAALWFSNQLDDGRLRIHGDLDWASERGGFVSQWGRRGPGMRLEGSCPRYVACLMSISSLPDYLNLAAVDTGFGSSECPFHSTGARLSCSSYHRELLQTRGHTRSGDGPKINTHPRGRPKTDRSC